MAARKSLSKRRHWRGETLCTLSTAMGRIGLLDYERELLTSGIVPEYLFFDELELTITRL
jgi:hypothetical protein